jgi:hypothetical protein
LAWSGDDRQWQFVAERDRPRPHDCVWFQFHRGSIAQARAVDKIGLPIDVSQQFPEHRGKPPQLLTMYG